MGLRELLVLKQSNEITRNKLLMHYAVDFIVEDPLRFARQTILRFVRYWTYPKPKYSVSANVGIAIYTIMFVLALIGIMQSKVKEKNIQLLLIFLIHYLCHTILRLFGLFGIVSQSSQF